MMEFLEAGKNTVNCECADFEDAFEIWCIKPHVVNRRLAGCSQVFQTEFTLSSKTSHERMEQITESVLRHLTDECFEGHNFQVWLETFICQCRSRESNASEMDIKVMLRKLLPRNLQRYKVTLEFIFTYSDVSNVIAMFVPLCIDGGKTLLFQKSWLFKFNARNIHFCYYLHKDFDCNLDHNALLLTKTWLAENLVPKLKLWAEASFQSNTPLRKTQSLSLVDVEKYTQIYTALKKKYGPHFVQIWPENTDPLKFVYEDIAIATYLLLIWEQERALKGSSKKQSFIDLGCGNGLLVHILINEGHTGKGVDISRRKIWSLYDKATVLEETTLLPNTMKVNEDWIIGNHSDELTPWIPVIAARSSYSTNYFVLPCCFHDFSSKFHRTGQKNPQYQTYLEYIFSIGLNCGFRVEQDTLRIPSTKRICQVGRCRTYPIEGHCDIDCIISHVLKTRSCSFGANNEVCDNTFLPRIVDNNPRNCSHIDNHIKTVIINQIYKTLLEEESFNYEGEKISCTTTSGHSWLEWNSGGNIHLNKLVMLLDNQVLKELKSQHGGLQTLLKNNRNIFKVVDGMVSLRDYRKSEDMKPSRKSLMKKQNLSSEKYKTKSCWFFEHHPQGCVLTSAECTFAHGDTDLRIKAINITGH